MKLQVYADAAYGNVEQDSETKSVMGHIVFLSNEKDEINPIHWKTKVIERVAEDTKTAETLALETAVDDAVYLSNMIAEVYLGKVGEPGLPLIIKEDSKSLIESVYSTRKVRKKTMRVVISSLQQKLKQRTIEDIEHVSSQFQLADILTKKGVSSFMLLKSLEEGYLPKLEN